MTAVGALLIPEGAPMAVSAGGITTVSHIDHDNFGVLGFYAKTCTIVVGD